VKDDKAKSIEDKFCDACRIAYKRKNEIVDCENCSREIRIVNN
jgi:hypothetical protein